MIVKIVFIALLAAAAISDLITYRIPNLVVIGLVVLFAIAAGLHFSDVSWFSQFGAAALSLLIGLGFYYFRQMGAGDVKLVSAIALWAGLYDAALVAFLLYVALAGLGIMLVILAVRYGIVAGERLSLLKPRPPERLPRIFRLREGIPYGSAIAVGAIAAIGWFPAWLWA